MQVNRGTETSPVPNKMPNKILLTIKTTFQSIVKFTFRAALAHGLAPSKSHKSKGLPSILRVTYPITLGW